MNPLANALKIQAETLWDKQKSLLITDPTTALELQNMAFEAARQADELCGQVANKQRKELSHDVRRKVKKIALKAVSTNEL